MFGSDRPYDRFERKGQWKRMQTVSPVWLSLIGSVYGEVRWIQRIIPAIGSIGVSTVKNEIAFPAKAEKFRGQYSGPTAGIGLSAYGWRQSECVSCL